MRILYFILYQLFFAIITLTAMAQKTSFPDGIVPDGLGYNIHFTDAQQGELEMLAASGVKIIRNDLTWSRTERQKGIYNFSAYDQLNNSLKKYNIKTVYVLDYTNKFYDEGLSPYTPEGRAAFAKWAVAAAIHFKDQGILWEMYNEPNIATWKPKPNVADYILLTLETGKALREKAPNELFIGPATSLIDINFLEQCFKAGVLEYWDAVSVHPYRQQSPETVIPEYAKLRWLIDKYAPKGKHIPILSGEWGYSSAWANFDDDIQGKMLPRQWMVNLACDIPISIWYDWRNDGIDPTEAEHNFGTTNFEYRRDNNPVYNPKPSYIAARTFNNVFNGFKYNKRLYITNSNEQRDNIYIFLFENGEDVRLAAWTSGKGQETLTIPCNSGLFKVVSHLGEKLSDLKADKNGLTISVTNSPIYLIPQTPNTALLEAAKNKGLPLAIYLSKDQEVGNTRLTLNRFQSTPIITTQKYNNISFKEKSQVYPALPLTMNLPTVGNNELIVQFNNTSREAFSGKLHLDSISGLDLLIKNPMQIKLKEGEFQTETHIPIKDPANKTFSLSLSLVQNNNNTRISKPIQKFRIIDNFAKYTGTELLNTNWTLVPDGNPKVNSVQSVTPNKNGALKITYQFANGWKLIRLIPKNNALSKIEGKPQSLIMRINDDGSGSSIRLRFRDSQGQTFQVTGGVLNKKGIRNIMFDLTGKKDTTYSGGANDGVIHYPILFDSLIIDGINKASSPYSIDIFSPMLVYE